MLRLSVVLEEGLDDETQEFVAVESVELRLEHSLVSLSKWESKFEKPFLNDEEKSMEETLAYVECMILGDYDPEILKSFSSENLNTVNEYINAKMTATWFAEGSKRPPSREVITSELVYYWMIALNIPFDCQHWHLNRLLTLVQVCTIKNQPAKKMSRRQAAERHRQLNAQRKAQLNTRG